jgi:hypothetical protein
MSTSPSISTLDQLLDPVAECFTAGVARQIVELQTDPRSVARLEQLREKANFGTLSDDERVEYEEFVEGMDLVAILKAKAKAVLEKQSQ